MTTLTGTVLGLADLLPVYTQLQRVALAELVAALEAAGHRRRALAEIAG